MIDVAKIGSVLQAGPGEARTAGRVEVVELLVPGLGPVDRDALLRPSGVERITGDNKAALYRAGPPDSGVVLDKRGRPLVREVYDWTRLTIGGASRALWLFLLPFLLINLVAWMQPRWPNSRDAFWTKAVGAVYEFGARLLALSLTVLVVGTFGQLAMDQFAWQCAPQATPSVCAPGNQAVQALGRLPGPQVGLVAAAVAPALVVFVLLLVARSSKQEYLPVRETVSARRAEQARRKRVDGHPLELPGFWEHNRRDPGMAAQHVWAGLLTTAALLTWTPMHEDPRGSVSKALGIALFCVILAMALVVVVSVPGVHRTFRVRLPKGSWRADRVERSQYLRGKRETVKLPEGSRRTRCAARLRHPRGGTKRKAVQTDVLPLWPTHYPVLAGLSFGLVTVAAALYCALPEREWRVQGQLPGIMVQSTALLVAQGVGIVLLLVSAVFLPRTRTRRRMALFGHAGAAMAVLACFVGWLYTDAVAQWTSSWLARNGERPQVPEPVELMGMLLLPVLIAALVCWLVINVVVRLLPVPCLDPDRPRRGLRDRAQALREGARVFRRRLPRRARAWRRRTRHPVRAFRTMRRCVGIVRPETRLHKDDRRHLHEVRAARRKHHYLLRELDWMIGITAVVILLAVAAYYLHWGIRKSQEGARNLVYDVLGTMSLPLLAGLAALMLLAFRTLALRPEMRQNAGLAWAFGAFWPRAAHPFAPPSWTVRAVPEFVWRLKALLKNKDRRILIRANSMGAVLALAAVWQLKAADRERIALLTTGCPVQKYFTRQYPGFVCAESIGSLAPCGSKEKLAGWINVWRDTDPLGGPVGLSCVDLRWTDEDEEQLGAGGGPFRRTDAEPVFPPIDGHRCYTTDKRLIPLRTRLVEQLLRPTTAEVADLLPATCAGSCANGTPPPPQPAAGDPTADTAAV